MSSGENTNQLVGPRLIRPRIELYREGNVYGRIAAGQVTVHPKGIPGEELATSEAKTQDAVSLDRLDWNELDADWFAEQRTRNGLSGSLRPHTKPSSNAALLQLRADEVLVGPSEHAENKTSGENAKTLPSLLPTTEQGGLHLSRQRLLLRGRVVLQVGDAAIRADKMLLDMPRGNVSADGPVICRWGAYQNPPPPDGTEMAQMAAESSPSGGTLVAGHCSYDLERRRFVCDRVAGAVRIQRQDSAPDERRLQIREALPEITALGLELNRSLLRRLKDGEPAGIRGWSTRLEAAETQQSRHRSPGASKTDSISRWAPNKDSWGTSATTAAYDQEAAYLRIRAERMQLHLDAAHTRDWTAERLSLAEAIHFSERALYDNRLEWDPSGSQHPGVRLEARRAHWHSHRRQGSDLRLEGSVLHVNKRLALPVLRRSLDLGQSGLSTRALEQLLDQSRSMTQFAYDVERHGGAYLQWPLRADSWQVLGQVQVRATLDLVSRLAASIPFARRWMLRGSLEMLPQKKTPWNMDGELQLYLEQPPALVRGRRQTTWLPERWNSSITSRSGLAVPPAAQHDNGISSAGAVDVASTSRAHDGALGPQYRENLGTTTPPESYRTAADTRRARPGRFRAADWVGGYGRLAFDLSGGRSFLVSYRSQEAVFHSLLQFEPLTSLDAAPLLVTSNRPWTRLRKHWQVQGTIWQRKRVSFPDPHARVLERLHLVYERMQAPVLPTSTITLVTPSRMTAIEEDRVQRLALQYQVQVENLLYAGRRTRQQRTRPYVAGFAALDARFERTHWSMEREPWTLRGALVGGLRAQFGCFQQRLLDSTGFLFRVRQAFGIPSPLLHQHEGLATSLHVGFAQQLWGPVRLACERVWLYRSGFPTAISAKEMLVPLETNYVVEWQEPTFKMSVAWNAVRQQGHLRAAMTW
jgi:hypothetical protein